MLFVRGSMSKKALLLISFHADGTEGLCLQCRKYIEKNTLAVFSPTDHSCYYHADCFMIMTQNVEAPVNPC